MDKRTAIFIDGANLFYVEKSLDFNIHFQKMANFFNKKFNIFNMFYYTGIDYNLEKEVEFLNELSFMGYTVRTKKIKIIHTGDGEKNIVKKANLDIEIVIDMLNTRDLYDRVILISGDSDFLRALELLRSGGKEIWVMNQKGHVSRELVNCADRYMDISELKPYIAKIKKPYRKTARAPRTKKAR